MTRIAWTDEQTAALVDGWGKATARLLAMDTGKSRNAVIGKAHRLGLARQPPTSRPRPTIVPTAGVPLIDATEFQCRYPVAGRGRALMICGQPTHAIGDWRSAFCEGHHAVCYQPLHTRTRDRPKPGRLTAGNAT